MDRKKIIRALIRKIRELDDLCVYYKESYNELDKSMEFCNYVRDKIGHKPKIVLTRGEIKERIPGDLDIPF